MLCFFTVEYTLSLFFLQLFSLNLVTKSGAENAEVVDQGAAAAAISHAAEIERARAADEHDARERMLASV